MLCRSVNSSGFYQVACLSEECAACKLFKNSSNVWKQHHARLNCAKLRREHEFKLPRNSRIKRPQYCIKYSLPSQPPSGADPVWNGTEAVCLNCCPAPGASRGAKQCILKGWFLPSGTSNNCLDATGLYRRIRPPTRRRSLVQVSRAYVKLLHAGSDLSQTNEGLGGWR